MAFQPYTAVSGGWRLSTNTYKRTASTDFTANELVGRVAAAGLGTISPADSSTTLIVGIGQRTITSATSGYATASIHPVLVPKNGLDSLMIGDITGDAATSTETPTLVDLTDAGNANVGASTVKALYWAKYLSASKGLFAINPAAVA